VKQLNKLFFLLISLFLVACDENALENRQSDVSPSTGKNILDKRDALYQATRLEIPEQSKVIFFEEVKGSDLYVRAKIEMKREVFFTWLKLFYRDEQYFSEDKRYYLEPDTPAWHPSKEIAMKAEQILFENGQVLNIGFINSSQSEVLIYLVFHGT
jgi:hypothetical protein